MELGPELAEERIRPFGLELRPVVRGHLHHDTRLLKALDLDVAGRMAVLETLGDGAVEADPDVVIRLPWAMKPTVRALRPGVLHEVKIADHSHDVSFTNVREWRGVLGVVTLRDACRRVAVEGLNRRPYDVSADRRGGRWCLVLEEVQIGVVLRVRGVAAPGRELRMAGAEASHVLASATLSVPGLCGKVVSPVGPRRGCQELEGQPDAGKDSLVRRAGRLQSLPSEPSQQRRKILAIVDQAHLAATILRRVT